MTIDRETEQKRKPGRPKVSNPKRRCAITWLPDDVMENLQQHAAYRSVSRSTWIRDAILMRMENTSRWEPDDDPIDYDDDY